MWLRVTHGSREQAGKIMSTSKLERIFSPTESLEIDLNMDAVRWWTISIARDVVGARDVYVTAYDQLS